MNIDNHEHEEKFIFSQEPRGFPPALYSDDSHIYSPSFNPLYIHSVQPEYLEPHPKTTTKVNTRIQPKVHRSNIYRSEIEPEQLMKPMFLKAISISNL